MEKVLNVFKIIFGNMSLRKHPFLFLLQFIVLIIIAYTLIPIFVELIAYIVRELSSLIENILQGI
jgi:hypothetical protein